MQTTGSNPPASAAHGVQLRNAGEPAQARAAPVRDEAVRENPIRGPDKLTEAEGHGIVSELNEAFSGRRLKFEVDKDLGEVVIRLVDRESQEVVKEIPSDEARAFKEKIKDIRGLLFDRKI